MATSALTDRRTFLRRAALVATGLVAADQLDLLDRLSGPRIFTTGIDIRNPGRVTWYVYRGSESFEDLAHIRPTLSWQQMSRIPLPEPQYLLLGTIEAPIQFRPHPSNDAKIISGDVFFTRTRR